MHGYNFDSQKDHSIGEEAKPAVGSQKIADSTDITCNNADEVKKNISCKLITNANSFSLFS